MNRISNTANAQGMMRMPLAMAMPWPGVVRSCERMI